MKTVPILLEYDENQPIGVIDLNDTVEILDTIFRRKGHRISLEPGGVVKRSHADKDGETVIDEMELTHFGLVSVPVTTKKQQPPPPGGKKALTEPTHERHDGAVHGWFSLTYSHYLVLQRSILQEMPTEWQERFIACIEEIRDYFDCSQMEDDYMVKLRDERGRFKRDPLCDYRHPDLDYINNMRWVKPKEDNDQSNTNS